MLGDDIVFTQTRSNLSPYMAAGAALFARNAHSIESSYKGAIADAPRVEHRSYCMGAVLLSSSFLESAIGELFHGAGNPTDPTLGARKELAVKMVAEWPTLKRTPNILRKYQTALALAGAPGYDVAETAYDDADTLVKLRNAIAHYIPEWDDELDLHRLIEHRLAGRFAISRFAGTDQAFFPEKCLGHGCSSWALTAALCFYRNFMVRMKLPENPALAAMDLRTEQATATKSGRVA